MIIVYILKLESKDLLLGRVWHSDRVYPFQPRILGVRYLWPCWRVSFAELYLLRLCLNVVLQVCSLSPSRRKPFLRSASLGQGVILNRRVFSLLQIIFILYLPLKLCNWIRNQNCNNVQLSKHFFCLILICDVLCVITWVMTHRNNPG
jgi:hypothetical protein